MQSVCACPISMISCMLSLALFLGWTVQPSQLQSQSSQQQPIEHLKLYHANSLNAPLSAYIQLVPDEYIVVLHSTVTLCELGQVSASLTATNHPNIHGGLEMMAEAGDNNGIVTQINHVYGNSI